MKPRSAILLRDLPNCPKGRIFEEQEFIIGCPDFFHSMTDEECINRQYKHYCFSNEEVEQNPDWFKIINP
ncbi:MAG: hypothetical protein LLF95_11350 [Bacteroidales bacterium]|nr:hypothetical protein [Bacteroidales bacterium]